MEWQFSGEVALSTGLLQSVNPGDSPKWNVGFKQGVYFLSPQQIGQSSITVSMHYNASENELDFEFK